ncbi:hypothetical protein QBC35DRAFT_480675 [Podospora australis]|uniref:Uncharacterized protein n=1 Tax=Podospora australis TaxID=1536484 RepID=A0AAN6X5T7_9PEZI|nr:hypothetical protein QBC35DRAFT_480675 [Podospora australis]
MTRYLKDQCSSSLSAIKVGNTQIRKLHSYSSCEVALLKVTENKGISTMSLLQSYRGLSPRAKLSFGIGLLAWGVIGLQLSDKAEEKLGYTPTEEDKKALERMTPKIHTVTRDKP